MGPVEGSGRVGYMCNWVSTVLTPPVTTPLTKVQLREDPKSDRSTDDVFTPTKYELFILIFEINTHLQWRTKSS